MVVAAQSCLEKESSDVPMLGKNGFYGGDPFSQEVGSGGTVVYPRSDDSPLIGCTQCWVTVMLVGCLFTVYTCGAKAGAMECSCL